MADISSYFTFAALLRLLPAIGVAFVFFVICAHLQGRWFTDARNTMWAAENDGERTNAIREYNRKVGRLMWAYLVFGMLLNAYMYSVVFH